MQNTKKPKQDFYVSMAARMTSEKLLVEEIILRCTHKNVHKIERLVIGVSNEVYKVWVSSVEKPDYILRIHHGKHPQFELEKWSFEQVSLQGVPVPQVIDIGTIKYKGKLLTYCIESVIPGVSLESMLDKGLSDDEKSDYTLQAGMMLAKIHKVQTIGHGHLKSNGVGTYATLLESMQQLNDRDDLHVACKGTVMTVSDIDNAIAMINTVQNINASPHLVHVDYAPKHIFIDEGKISGIIDFELCLSGYAATDFNRWRAEESRITIDELLVGYEKITKLPSYFWDYMYIVQLHSALRTMLYHSRISLNEDERLRAASEALLLLNSGEALH